MRYTKQIVRTKTSQKLLLLYITVQDSTKTRVGNETNLHAPVKISHADIYHNKKQKKYTIKRITYCLIATIVICEFTFHCIWLSVNYYPESSTSQIALYKSFDVLLELHQFHLSNKAFVPYNIESRFETQCYNNHVVVNLFGYWMNRWINLWVGKLRPSDPRC